MRSATDMSLREMLDDRPPGAIRTIAGAGYKDGVPAKEADAGWPLGVVRRPDGDLIVADHNAHRLWRIDADEILHAFAGDGVPGNSGDGGPPAQARLRHPHDLCQDRDGNLYFSDLGNNTIRRVDYRTGTIDRVAGSGRAGRGGDGGPALEAELDVACGVAVDADGNVYIASEWGNNIRRVDAETGVINRFAGLDARLYSSEEGASRPYPGSNVSLMGYHGDGGPADEAAFQNPEHLAFDSRGDLYVCDNFNHRIRKIDMESGAVSTVMGTGWPSSSGDGGPAVEAGLLLPDSLFIDVHDNIYVGEKYGYRVRKVDAATGAATTVVGTGVPGFGEEGLSGTETTCNACEAGLWADPDGTVFWSDQSGRLRKCDGATGIVTTVFGGTDVGDGGPAADAYLNGPGGLCAGPNGTVYIADEWSHRVRAVDPDTGLVQTVAGNGAKAYGGENGPATQAYVSNPFGVSLDSRGGLVIAEKMGGFLRRIDQDGVIRVIAGSGLQVDRGDGGPALNACFYQIRIVAHDADDNIYVGDDIGRIRRIDVASGTISTVAGTGIRGYTGDGGLAAEARIGAPAAIDFDRSGNLYFCGRAYHVVRKVDGRGVITTVAGSGAAGFSPDGTFATAAQLDRPMGVAVSANSAVYISDTGNNRVRVIDAKGRLRTVAGSDEPGDAGDGDPALTARLNEPRGLCLLGDDILLVSDHFNNKIKAVRLVPRRG